MFVTCDSNCQEFCITDAYIMLSATSRPNSTAPTGSKSSVSRGKNDKSASVEVETPKQIQKRLLKAYEHYCAADGSLALPSVKRTLRAGMHQKSLQARVIMFKKRFRLDV